MKQKIRVFVETEGGNAVEYLPIQEEYDHEWAYEYVGTNKLCVKCKKREGKSSSPKPIECTHDNWTTKGKCSKCGITYAEYMKENPYQKVAFPDPKPIKRIEKIKTTGHLYDDLGQLFNDAKEELKKGTEYAKSHFTFNYSHYPKTTMNKSLTEIEKMFDEYVYKKSDRGFDGTRPAIIYAEDAKLFYRSQFSALLTEQRHQDLADIEEVVEDMKLPDPNPYGKWVSIGNVNKMLDKIKSKLKSLPTSEGKKE